MDFEHLLFSYRGRTRRSHWWAAQIVLGVLLLIVRYGWKAIQAALTPKGDQITIAMFGVAFLLLVGLLLWMCLAVSVKRLHDRNWSGWLVLVTLIPIVGGLFSLICLGIMDGTRGPNNFGPSPKFPTLELEAFA